MKIPALALRLLTLGAIIPAALGCVTYVGFFTNYTVYFSRTEFEAQYLHGVYGYRVLGREAVLWVHELIKHRTPPYLAPAVLTELEPGADPVFYIAYALTNTAFLCLACAPAGDRWPARASD